MLVFSHIVPYYGGVQSLKQHLFTAVVVTLLSFAFGFSYSTYGQSAKPIQFGPPLLLPQIELPNTTVWTSTFADFNEDGYIDVGLSFSSPNINFNRFNCFGVAFGEGNGRFRDARRLSSGHIINSASISHCDFNGDKHMDLVVSGDSSLGVLIGSGDGGFSDQPLDWGGNWHMITSKPAITDLDGNGSPDIIVSYEEFHNFVAFYNGQTNPVFIPFEWRPFDINYGELFPGDFDKDGKIDLYGVGGKIDFLHGSSPTNFDKTRDVVSTIEWRAEVRDLNNDGNSDLIGFRPSYLGARLDTFFGDGTGALSPAVTNQVIAGQSCFAAGDVDGDGIIDVVIGTSSKFVVVLRGDGTGKFHEAGKFSVPFIPSHVNLADLDNDEMLDIFAAGAKEDGTGVSSVLLNVSKYALQSGDIVWQNQEGRLATWMMNAQQFVGAIALQTTTSIKPWRAVSVGDLNRDGLADIVFQNNTGRLAFSSVAGTTLQSFNAVTRPGSLTSAARVLTTADFNGDGWQDIIWTDQNNIAVTYLLGTNFLTTKQISSSVGGWLGWSLVGAGNFTGDARAEFLWLDGNRTLWISDQWGPFSAHAIRVNQSPFAAGWQVATIADYNGDGFNDIWWQHTSGRLAVWLMKGATRIGVASVRNGYPAAPGWRVVGVP